MIMTCSLQITTSMAAHKDSPQIDSHVWKSFFTQGVPDGCWIGCNMSCAKAVDDFELKSGPYKGQKVIVDGPEYENAAGLGSNCGIFDPDISLKLTSIAILMVSVPSHGVHQWHLLWNAMKRHS